MNGRETFEAWWSSDLRSYKYPVVDKDCARYVWAACIRAQSAPVAGQELPPLPGGLLLNGVTRFNHNDMRDYARAALAAQSQKQADPVNSVDETSTEHARRWATELACSMAAKYYPEVMQWEPLPDLLGVMAQIDNMTTGLVRATAASQEQGDLARDGRALELLRYLDKHLGTVLQEHLLEPGLRFAGFKVQR